MVEHGAGVEDHLEQEHRERWRAERHHHHDLPQHRERDLYRVKAHRRGHVDVAVGMVHLVQPPEERDFVGGQMLHPDGEVEREKRQDNLDPRRPGHVVEKPDLVLFSIECGGYRRDRHREHRHQTQHDAAGDADADIGEPAPSLRGVKRPLRPAELDQRHHKKDAEEDGEADGAVALADETVHRGMLAGIRLPVSWSALRQATGRRPRGSRARARPS